MMGYQLVFDGSWDYQLVFVYFETNLGLFTLRFFTQQSRIFHISGMSCGFTAPTTKTPSKSRSFPWMSTDVPFIMPIIKTIGNKDMNK